MAGRVARPLVTYILISQENKRGVNKSIVKTLTEVFHAYVDFSAGIQGPEKGCF